MCSCCSSFLSWSVSKWQAEKRLKEQLMSVEQQQVKAQEGVKEKQNQLEKLQAQLQTVQGCFEVEAKKLKGQIAEFQENGAKKASRDLKWKQILVSTSLSICCYASVMFVDVLDVFILYIVGRRGKAASGAGVRTEWRAGFREVSHHRTAKDFGAKPGKWEQAAVWPLRQRVWSVCPASRPEGALA